MDVSLSIWPTGRLSYREKENLEPTPNRGGGEWGLSLRADSGAPLEARQMVSHRDLLMTRTLTIIDGLHVHPAVEPVLVPIWGEGP